MAKVARVLPAGYADVYNMEVEDNHNYAVNGGLIVHNCDSLRYFTIYYSRPNEVRVSNDSEIVWTKDMLEDYYRARRDKDTEALEAMKRKWGTPVYSA